MIKTHLKNHIKVHAQAQAHTCMVLAESLSHCPIGCIEILNALPRVQIAVSSTAVYYYRLVKFVIELIF